MKKELTPAEYNLLSDTDKGLYELIYVGNLSDKKWHDANSQYLYRLKPVEDKTEIWGHLDIDYENGIETFTPVEAPVKESVEEVLPKKYPKGGVEEKAFYSILNAISEAPHAWNIIPHFVDGAIFGASWQKEQDKSEFKKQVIALLEVAWRMDEITSYDWTVIISKIKSL